jgi:hypothetical protein
MWPSPLAIAAQWMVNVLDLFVSTSLYADKVIVCRSSSCVFKTRRDLQTVVHLLLRSVWLNGFLFPVEQTWYVHFIRLWGLHTTPTCSLTTALCRSRQISSFWAFVFTANSRGSHTLHGSVFFCKQHLKFQIFKLQVVERGSDAGISTLPCPVRLWDGLWHFRPQLLDEVQLVNQ